MVVSFSSTPGAGSAYVFLVPPLFFFFFVFFAVYDVLHLGVSLPLSSP